MTLNLGLAASWGAWLCTDYRLTRLDGSLYDDYSPKFVSVQCVDGTALVTYSGLGLVSRKGKMLTSEWVREVLRGENRTLDQSLIQIRERATAELSVHRCWLLFFILATFAKGNRWIVSISNLRQPEGYSAPPEPAFSTRATEVLNEQLVLAHGSGVESIGEDDAKMLRSMAGRQPRNPTSYLRLLARVNRRVADARPPQRKDVSPWCVTVYMPPDGTGVQQRTFYMPKGAPHHVGGLWTVNRGIDFTEVTQPLMERVRDPDAHSDEEWEHLHAEATERSVRRGGT